MKRSTYLDVHLVVETHWVSTTVRVHFARDGIDAIHLNRFQLYNDQQRG